MEVLKNVNLHLVYVSRCLRNQMQKKVEHKLTTKKSYEQSSRHTWNQKIEKHFINYYYLTVKVKKNNGTYTVLMLNYVSEVAYEA